MVIQIIPVAIARWDGFGTPGLVMAFKSALERRAVGVDLVDMRGQDRRIP